MMRRSSLFAPAVLFLLAGLQSTYAGLINGGFEAYGQPAGNFSTFPDAANGGIPGWNTTAADHLIEIWGTGFNGIPPTKASISPN